MTGDMPFARGPYLLDACICEKVLEEKDGVKSAIRMIDRLMHTVASPAPPHEMEPFEHAFAILIRLKSGNIRGSRPLEIKLVKPSSEISTLFRQTIYFEGEDDRGIDIVVNMRMRFELTGLYWFQIHLDDMPITQIPLRVIYIPRVKQVPGERGHSRPDQGSPRDS
ncbi:MAG: hypothetical protein SV910_08610 [Chloroflexota bacterium]|nr:hypothetical protein [Chloroflexota bacterium]